MEVEVRRNEEGYKKEKLRLTPQKERSCLAANDVPLGISSYTGVTILRKEELS